MKPEMTVDKIGTKRWYLNYQLHRKDGPALELSNGSKWWYLNGERHRENGPAVEHSDGTKSWYLNGKLHREDGPAIEWVDGLKEWYFHGEKIGKCPFNPKGLKVGDLVGIQGQLGILFKKDTFVRIQLDEKEMVFVND